MNNAEKTNSYKNYIRLGKNAVKLSITLIFGKLPKSEFTDILKNIFNPIYIDIEPQSSEIKCLEQNKIAHEFNNIFLEAGKNMLLSMIINSSNTFFNEEKMSLTVNKKRHTIDEKICIKDLDQKLQQNCDNVSIPMPPEDITIEDTFKLDNELIPSTSDQSELSNPLIINNSKRFEIISDETLPPITKRKSNILHLESTEKKQKLLHEERINEINENFNKNVQISKRKLDNFDEISLFSEKKQKLNNIKKNSLGNELIIEENQVINMIDESENENISLNHQANVNSTENNILETNNTFIIECQANNDITYENSNTIGENTTYTTYENTTYENNNNKVDDLDENVSRFSYNSNDTFNSESLTEEEHYNEKNIDEEINFSQLDENIVVMDNELDINQTRIASANSQISFESQQSIKSIENVKIDSLVNESEIFIKDSDKTSKKPYHFKNRIEWDDKPNEYFTKQLRVSQEDFFDNFEKLISP